MSRPTKKQHLLTLSTLMAAKDFVWVMDVSNGDLRVMDRSHAIEAKRECMKNIPEKVEKLEKADLSVVIDKIADTPIGSKLSECIT